MELFTDFRLNNNTIIFLHGGSSSSRVFNPILNSDLDYNMVAYDLSGHGRSIKTGNAEDYGLVNNQKYLKKEISKINGNKILVGNSYGGHLAIEIAEDIDNLKGLVIFGTPPPKKPLNLEEAINFHDATPVYFTENPEKELVENLFTVASANPNVHNILVEDFFNADPKVRVAIANDIENRDVFKDEYKIFLNLNIPKLVLQGDKEPLVNKDYIIKTCKEANAELIEIENCAHYISLEKPDLFNEIIDKFAKKCFNHNK